jgi:hypothetical protein
MYARSGRHYPDNRREGRVGGRHNDQDFHRYRQPVNIKEQLERNMKEWGVDHNYNHDHRKVWDESLVFVRGIRVCRGNVEHQAASQLEVLPTDPVEAVRHVMIQDFSASLNINMKKVLVITDRLKDMYPGVPVQILHLPLICSVKSIA